MADWQPIETAPKDGMAILAFWSPASGDAVTRDCYGVTYYELGEWLNPDNPDDAYDTPAYWTPLPDPPDIDSDTIEEHA